MQRPEREGVLLTSLLPTACSARFLIESRTASLGMESPTVDWALPHQSLIKNMAYRLAYSLILLRHFVS